MDSSVQLTEYAGLVDSVFAKLSDALKPQLGDGPSQAATRTHYINSVRTPAERALDLRFALGGDTVTYLNNGVALLAAGTARGAVDVSGLVGGDVLAGVKNAVYNEMRRRQRLDLQNLDEVRSLVVWLLCIPEVAKAFFLFRDTEEEDEPYKPYGGSNDVHGDNDSLAQKLQTIAGYSGADLDAAVDSVQSIVRGADTTWLRTTIETLLMFLKPSEGPRLLVDGLFDNIEKDHVMQAQVRGTPGTTTDLVMRFAMLEQEIATDVAQANGTGGDDATEWLDACREGATKIEDDLPIAKWVKMAGLIGEVGPGEKREVNGLFSYHMSLSKTLSLPRDKADPSFDLNWSESLDHSVNGIARKYENVLAVCLIGCNVGETGVAVTMPVRWMPQGPLATDQCRAAVLEHVIENMKLLKDNTAAACVAASAKLLQLEHLQRIRESGSDRARGVDNVPLLVTPNAQHDATFAPKLRLGAPFLRKQVETTFVVQERLTRENLLKDLASSDAETRKLLEQFAKYEQTAEAHNTTLRTRHLSFSRDWPYSRVIPSDKDIVVSIHDFDEAVPEAVLGSKRRLTGERTKVKAELLSADSLAGYLCNGVRLCKLVECKLIESDPSLDDPSPTLPQPSPGPEATRATLWNEMLREISISSDRLWVFVKLLSGAMGESAETLLTVADEAAQKAQRAFEAARKDIADKTAAFHVKLVEIVTGGILRGSKLEAIPDHQDENEDFTPGLFVADAEMAKEIRALASGESGRPFFEANVAIQGVLRAKNGKKVPMKDLIASLEPIVQQLNSSMQAELSNASGGALGLAALSAPRNSYMVSLRDDVVAALRIAHDRLCNELGSRQISLWELVEGASGTLSLRFAEFVAQVLVATRASSGTAALYVSHQMITTNVHQARAALGRLVKECRGCRANSNPQNAGKSWRRCGSCSCRTERNVVSAGTCQRSGAPTLETQTDEIATSLPLRGKLRLSHPRRVREYWPPRYTGDLTPTVQTTHEIS